VIAISISDQGTPVGQRYQFCISNTLHDAEICDMHSPAAGWFTHDNCLCLDRASSKIYPSSLPRRLVNNNKKEVKEEIRRLVLS
jgi:hypothetical protein